MKRLLLVFTVLIVIMTSCSNPVNRNADYSNFITAVNLESSKATLIALAEVKNTVLMLQQDILSRGLLAIGEVTVDANKRSLVDITTGDEIISVSQEQEVLLNSLVDEYKASLPIPPIIFTASVPDGFIEDERYVYYGGITFDKLDPETIPILYNLVEIYDHQLCNETLDLSRGLHWSNVSLWPSKKPIRVYISDQLDSKTKAKKITDAQAASIFSSINQWAIMSKNAVTFTRFYPTSWDVFCYGIGVTKFVKVQVVSPNEGAAAYTDHVGYAGTGARLNICSDWWTQVNTIPAAYNGVIAHEMGHLLGLLHEHQRPDRDTYIKLGSKPADMSQSAWDYNTKKLKPAYILFIKSWWPISTGAFDFNSVMIYGSPFTYHLDGSNIYQSSSISATDGITLDDLY